MTADFHESTVKLVSYDQKYEAALKQFYLPEEQSLFSRLPLDKIHEPTQPAKTIHVIILENNVPVGYFALEHGEKRKTYTESQAACLLTSFSIDYKHQGKGLAKKGLQLLPDYINTNLPAINEVVLGVNQKNEPAINLYLNAGFVDNNEVYEGPKGPQQILHLKV
ncbi:acetyltransferase (GNAT) family protein [Salsuginibacillus halophilus]|uniref:Acetyltransferase (GNAT) family protein n=1 Tax=Salsuginibacillus halophilus TaxID=517424 RepID=A0A2P8H8A8_9BACI|nr:GNAT family N-acetyltransferase [Salsuginibacillus halophilus]PSL42431.1 acetyltransferase (GNAT) family protein [Salsuginibacillus halophilus]